MLFITCKQSISDVVTSLDISRPPHNPSSPPTDARGAMQLEEVYTTKPPSIAPSITGSRKKKGRLKTKNTVIY
jgi:hypothetical protein